MSTINQRLTFIINKHLKLKDVAIADLLGVSRQTITNIATSRSKPSWDVIEAISIAAPNVSAEWILRDKGEVLLSDGAGSDSDINPNTEVSGRNQISQNNGKSGTININQHNEQVFRLLEQQLAAQSVTIAAQAKTIEALSQQIARLNEQLNGGNG